jgi:hypothetical protein
LKADLKELSYKICFRGFARKERTVKGNGTLKILMEEAVSISMKVGESLEMSNGKSTGN